MVAVIPVVGQSTALSYLRGLLATAVQRRQRTTWLLSFAPHFAQRRFFSFMAKRVRGRLFMGSRTVGGQAMVG